MARTREIQRAILLKSDADCFASATRASTIDSVEGSSTVKAGLKTPRLGADVVLGGDDGSARWSGAVAEGRD